MCDLPEDLNDNCQGINMGRTRILSKALVAQLFLGILFMGLAGAKSPQNNSGGGPKFVPEELIVKFKGGVSDREIDAINMITGTSVLSVNRIAHFMRLRIHGSDRSVRQLVRRYRAREDVQYAEPNYIVHTSLFSDDPSFSQLWALYNSGQSGGSPGADIYATDAWDLETGSSSVVVAVIDTGVDYDHEDLSANIWINEGEIPGNGIDDDDNGFIDDIRGWNFIDDNNDPIDNNAHGTHVSGTIAAVGNNGTGVSGVNWKAQVMSLKFLDAQGNGTTVNAVKAIQYATMMGVRIVNNSWGGSGFSQTLKDAIVEADEAGVIFVAAAGNNGLNNDISQFYPANYDVPNIITVAATDHNDTLAVFSNYGPSSVEVGAPGVDIFSTTLNDTYGYMSGTSMATPHVSGVAALLLAQFPALTNDEIKERILNSVDPVSSLKGMVMTGGRLNANDALLGVVPPELPDPAIIFEDDMESGTNNWTVSGETSLWHQSSERYASPMTSWYYGIEGELNYDTGGKNLGSITSPLIDLTAFTASTLNFDHFLDTEESLHYDKAFVRISNDGGNTFTDVFTRLTTNDVFIQETLNISAFDGDIIQIQFSFDTGDGLYNNHEGWYVDDIMVSGQIAEVPANLFPIADAGPDQMLSDANGDGVESVTLDGSDSYDPDGMIVAYEWKEGEIVLEETVAINVSLAVGSHIVTLTVTDDNGASESNDVRVVVDPNQQPSADAGSDQIVIDADSNGSENITLTGTGSSDFDGTIEQYEWSEGGIVLGTTASIARSFTVGQHTIVLTVTDSGGATDIDTVLLTVKEAPLSGPTINISSIDINFINKFSAKGFVRIVDNTGETISGAIVTGVWSLNAEVLKQVSAATNKKGAARLETGKVSMQSGDTLTLTILNASKEGFEYVPTDNVETSDWGMVP